MAALAATWFRPQRKQQKTSGDDGERVEVGLALGHRRRWYGSRRRASASASADAPAPAASPAAWANGAMAMSQPSGWRSASAPQGVSVGTLSASAAEERQRRPPGAGRAPWRSGAPRPPRRRHAARRTARRSGRVRARPARRAGSAARPAIQAPTLRCGTRGHEAEGADQRAAGEVGREVQRRSGGPRPRSRRATARAGPASAASRAPRTRARVTARAPRPSRAAAKAHRRPRRRVRPFQAKTARQSASTASRCAAIVSGSSWVGLLVEAGPVLRPAQLAVGVGGGAADAFRQQAGRFGALQQGDVADVVEQLRMRAAVAPAPAPGPRTRRRSCRRGCA